MNNLMAHSPGVPLCMPTPLSSHSLPPHSRSTSAALILPCSPPHPTTLPPPRVRGTSCLPAPRPPAPPPNDCERWRTSPVAPTPRSPRPAAALDAAPWDSSVSRGERRASVGDVGPLAAVTWTRELPIRAVEHPAQPRRARPIDHRAGPSRRAGPASGVGRNGRGRVSGGAVRGVRTHNCDSNG